MPDMTASSDGTRSPIVPGEACGWPDKTPWEVGEPTVLPGTEGVTTAQPKRRRRRRSRSDRESPLP
jgi:hypothetical protein